MPEAVEQKTLAFKSLLRAWCEIEGSPRLPINGYARMNSLRIKGDILTIELPSCPEASALLQGVKYKAGPSFIGNFECRLSGTTGVLKTASGSRGYSIDENDLKTCSFMAYYLPSADAKEAVTVDVVAAITGSNQIVIRSGGRIETSRNLIGNTIKVQVRYPETVMLSDEKVESLYVHMVGVWEDDSLRYAGVSGCTFEAEGKLLKVRLGTVEMVDRLTDTP